MNYFLFAPIEHCKGCYVHVSIIPLMLVYIFGHPHTKDSYRAFSEHRGFGDIPLYREIYARPLPDDRPILDVRYTSRAAFDTNPRIIYAYPHAVLFYKLRPKDVNQFSYFDEDIVRNWYYDALSPRFIVLN